MWSSWPIGAVIALHSVAVSEPSVPTSLEPTTLMTSALQSLSPEERSATEELLRTRGEQWVRDHWALLHAQWEYIQTL